MLTESWNNRCVNKTLAYNSIFLRTPLVNMLSMSCLCCVWFLVLKNLLHLGISEIFSTVIISIYITLLCIFSGSLLILLMHVSVISLTSYLICVGERKYLNEILYLYISLQYTNVLYSFYEYLLAQAELKIIIQ